MPSEVTKENKGEQESVDTSNSPSGYATPTLKQVQIVSNLFVSELETSDWNRSSVFELWGCPGVQDQLHQARTACRIWCWHCGHLPFTRAPCLPGLLYHLEILHNSFRKNSMGSMCIQLNPVHTDITHSVLSFCHALFGGGQQLWAIAITKSACPSKSTLSRTAVAPSIKL